LIQSLSKF